MDRPLVVAHRGASAAAPENTIAAIRAALAAGADMVEVDVQRSRDGALVLVHDRSLVRTTDVRTVYPARAPWRVADLTLAEIRRLDAGSWWSPSFAGEQVPTLAEVLDLLGPRCGLQLELKTPGHHPGVVDDVVVALRGRSLSGLVVQSFDFAAMKALKARRPDLPVGLLGHPPAEHLPALASWAAQVNPSHLRVDRRYVDQVHAAGLSCLVWTVDRRFSMRRALRLGVDGVITNRPDRLTQLLAGAAVPVGDTTTHVGWGSTDKRSTGGPRVSR